VAGIAGLAEPRPNAPPGYPGDKPWSRAVTPLNPRCALADAPRCIAYPQCRCGRTEPEQGFEFVGTRATGWDDRPRRWTGPNARYEPDGEPMTRIERLGVAAVILAICGAGWYLAWTLAVWLWLAR